MALVPYRDWLPFNQLKDEINRLFNTVGDSETSGAMAGWVPSVDIYESDDRFDLLVDLPGVDPQKVELTLDNGVISEVGIGLTAVGAEHFCAPEAESHLVGKAPTPDVLAEAGRIDQEWAQELRRKSWAEGS